MNNKFHHDPVTDSQVPQPIRDGVGATDPGPRNVPLDLQNPDILTPPSTDAGTIPNMKFSFGLAHNRLQEGGWARQVTARELPIATTLAGVNMRMKVCCCACLHQGVTLTREVLPLEETTQGHHKPRGGGEGEA